MKLSSIRIAAVAVAGLASSVLADSTVQGRSTNQSGGLYSTYGGAYAHKFWSASDANTLPFTGGATSEAGQNETVYAFCTDGNNLNQGTVGTYHLIDVTDAPYHTGGNNGPNTYSAAQQTRLNAACIAAQGIGILDGRGFLSSTFATGSGSDLVGAYSKADWAQGLQWEIWGILGLESNIIGSTAARTAIQTAALAHVNDPILVRILGVSLPDGSTGGNQGQDMLVMVPLPPSACAGMGMMAGLLGAGAIRRRKLALA